MALRASVEDLNLYSIDAIFIPCNGWALPAWLSSTIGSINTAAAACPLFYQGNIWIPQEFYPDSMVETVHNILSSVQSG